MLLAYAAGNVSAAVALILATHLTLCPRCRASLSRAEAIGGALLENLRPTPVSAGVFDRLDHQLKRAGLAVETDSHQSVRNEATPAPLRFYLNGTLDQVRWISIAPGLAYRPVIADRSGARLVRSGPGRGIATHTHRGEEFSLVLAGGYTDSSGHYLPGDFQAADRSLTHRPIADDDADCVILTVTDASLSFSNPIAGLIAKLIGC